MMKKVAFQGIQGSFHELATIKHFGENITRIECLSFKDVFRALEKGEADYGIIAIENTVAGTILPNYAILRESGATIIGEVYLHIQQNLFALKGQSIEDIKEVHSHPMAILQCQAFFEKHLHIKLIEASDTASSAKWISDKQLKNTGAIAGLHVAELYNLHLLAKGIETDKKNFTRFLVIKKGNLDKTQKDFESIDGKNKSSICFNVKHKKGSLAHVLTILAENDLNLTKIQSLPLPGREWEYYIHIDMEFESIGNYHDALSSIQPLLNEFKILGEYKRGIKYDS